MAMPPIKQNLVDVHSCAWGCLPVVLIYYSAMCDMGLG